MVDRRKFIDFLRNSGFASAPPPAPTPMPRYENQGMLGRGGVTGGPALNRQYVAPLPRPAIPPPANVVRGGTFTPEQVLDQFLNSPAAQFMDPAQLDSARARLTQEVTPPPPAPYPTQFSPRPEVVTPLRPVPQSRTSIDAWLALPPEVRAVTPPTDPQGKPYPNWTNLTPEQQAIITEQLAAGPVDDFLGLDTVSNTVGDAIVKAGDAPITPGSSITLGEALSRGWQYGGKPAVQVLGIPEEQYRMQTMDVAYYMSTHDGQLPSDFSDPGTYIGQWLLNPSLDTLPPEMQAFPPPNSGISDGAWLTMSNEQKAQAYVTASKDKDNPLSKLQIITYLDAHPEFRPTVKSIYETAEANGQDGTKAVDEWWTNQQGVVLNTVSSLIFDPLNLAGFAGVAGRGLRAAAKTKEAEEGVTLGSRVLRTGGTILEAPDAVINKPIETASTITRGAADVVGDLPVVRQLRDLLTQPGAQQRAVDAFAARENAVEQGVRLVENAAADVRANQQLDAIQKARRGEVNAPTDVVPGRNLTPDEAAAEREIQQRAANPENRPKPAAQSRVVSPQDGTQTGLAGDTRTVFDDAIGVNDPLPPNVQAAWDENAAIIGDPTGGRAIREIPAQEVPADARIIATQSELYPDTVQQYVNDPSWRNADELPIAIYDGESYWVVGGHHRVAAARKSGFDTIPMRVINATPAQAVDNAASLNPEITSRALEQNFPRNLPTGDPVEQARFSITPDAQKQRAIDTIARDYPEAWDAISPQLDEWATTEYEPAINRLRTASIDSSDIPGAAPLPDNYANRKAAMDAGGTPDREIQFYEGTNKAMAAALEGDYYGRLRFLAYANGVDLEKIAWRIDPRLERAIADRGLEKMGYRADQTFKNQTRESLVTAFIHADEADAPYILKALEDAHVVRAKAGTSEAARLENLRYQIITDARRRAQLTPEEMDQLLREAGLEPKPAQVAQEDLAVLPDETAPAPNGQVPQGGSLASQMTAQLKQLPEEVRAAAVKQVADWARVNMADFAVKTPRERVLTELEYAAEVRRAALRQGTDIALPPMDYTVDDTIDNMLRAIVLEPDETITAPLRKDLYDREILRKEIAPPWEGVTSPDVYVSEKVAFDTYQKTRDLRRALHGPPHEALRRNGRYEPTGKWQVYKNPDGNGHIIVDPDGHVDGLPIPNKREAVKQAKARAATQVSSPNVMPKTGTDPGMVTLYRVRAKGRTPGETGLGRWYVDNLEDAQFYVDNYRSQGIEPEIVTVRMPRSEAEQYKVRNRPEFEDDGTNPRIATGSEEGFDREYYIPQNLADQATPLQSPMRTFANEVEHNARLDQEIADASNTTPREARPPELPTAEEVATAQKAFEEAAARPMRPMSLADFSGDQMVADALRTGGIDKETAATLSRMVTLKDGRELSVMDIVLEKMVEHDDLITAHRAAASDIAEAVRKASRAASADIITADAIKMPELNKALRANRYYLNLVREAYLISPARVVSAGSLDAMGNAWFQLLGGHGGTSLRTMNPLAWLGFAKHTMSGAEVRHPLFEIAEKTGMRVDPSIVNVVTRDLLDSGVDTTWSDLFANKLHLGKVGDKASSVIAPKWGKAMRHGIDQNARAGVAWNVARHELPDARNDLLLHIRQTQGDEAANALVPKLSRSGVFSPEDVLKYTDDETLARWWRERLTEIQKKQVSEVNRIHFDFKITKADEVLRNVMLFHFWQSRAMVFYAKTVLGNPYLLNLHIKAYQALEKEAERQDAGNPFNLFLKYMGGNGGLYGYIDPISWFVPYVMYRDAAVDYQGESAFDKYSRKLGVFWNPAIQGAMTVLGGSDRFPALLPTTSLQTLIRSVFDWDRNHGGHLTRKGPGITGDPVTDVQNRVLDLLNGGLHALFPDQVNDVQMPDMKSGQTRQVESIIIENAEKDFGVPYIEMTPAQRNEVLQAIISLSGTPNARAEEALKTWSDGRIIQSGANMVVPGRTTVRSEAYDERRKLTDSAYDKPADQRTPAEQNALAQNDLANAGGPESATLAVENQNLDDVGTPVQKILYDGWNTIAFGDLQPGMMEIIGGKKYTSEQIMAMSPEDRMKLADLWVLDNHGTGQLKEYRDKRGELIDSSTELSGYKDYQKRAREYGGGETRKATGKTTVSDTGLPMSETVSTGGMRDFRAYLESVDPNFAFEIGQERKRLQDQGLSGEELEARLDIWANSPAGYNAFRGSKDRAGDPTPKDTFDPTKQLPPPGPGEQADSGGSSKSSGTKSDDYMPDYQVQLITDYDAYSKAVSEFEATNGPISNFQSPLGQRAVEQFFAERGIEISSDLKKYLAWAAEQQAAGKDDSMKAYIQKLNDDYEAKKKQREAARKSIESQ